MTAESCNAAAKPRRSVRRIVRDARARPVHGQSRRAHSYRRPNADQAPLGVAAVDLLRARLQEPPARRLGPLLHRAVFPRRGDRARRRAPALLRMPAQGCRSFRRFLAGRHSSVRARPARRRDGLGAARRAAGRPRQASAPLARSTICPMARSSLWRRAPMRCAATHCCAGRPRATTPASAGRAASTRRLC